METHQVLGFLILAIFLLVVVWMAWLAVLGVQGERVLTNCSIPKGNELPSRSISTDLELFPPRYYCVYKNRRGEVVARIRAR